MLSYLVWYIGSLRKRLEETTKDPKCCYVRADSSMLVSTLRTKGYEVDVFPFPITDLLSLWKTLKGDMKGIILEEYRGEDIAAIRNYPVKEKSQDGTEDVTVQKRLHVRLWKVESDKINGDKYLAKAHTEYDIGDPRHIPGIGVNFVQGCEWFRNDIADTDIKIILS
jgi:hypothetical protein